MNNTLNIVKDRVWLNLKITVSKMKNKKKEKEKNPPDQISGTDLLCFHHVTRFVGQARVVWKKFREGETGIELVIQKLSQKHCQKEHICSKLENSHNVPW